MEQSDSEEELEDMEGESSAATQSPSKGHSERWTEVTALYFKEIIWPKVTHHCGVSSKDFDPLLVWMEMQSFIKGSEEAFRMGRYLSLEEYKKIGNRMAPNFSDHRDDIYTVFLRYQKYQQNQRHRNFLFDACDLVLNLYNRLKDVQDVPWSIHAFYIDEVQDFTQAELALIVHSCRNPNSMFFTGDTAQSIMRGVMFRFQDLQSIFHRLNSNISEIKLPKKPFTLTTNFRSHSGILKLAGSVIDLIREYFKGSIDDLPDEVGMFPGPIPVVLLQQENCEVDDLALLLGMNKRKASAIEFGAHQVILVQSKEARDNLPPILKGAIVMTIFEAKGLEFDDVLLYNFFTDSMVDVKDWRVVSSYLEMTEHCEKIQNHTRTPGLSFNPRSLRFDPNLHKSLNSELKCLYTAITRAKCNLWMYDEKTDACLPMFDYWHKRGLVKVVSTENQDSHSIVFAANSTPEQWKAQGDNLKKRGIWEAAIHCYKNAGPANEYLAKEISACILGRRARQQKPQLFLEAAVAFLECDEAHHDLHYLRSAAQCLKQVKLPKFYSEAGKLYERFGDLDKAAQLYKKGNDAENFAKLAIKRGRYYVKYFKESKLYDKAYDTLVESDMLKDACRLAMAQGGCIGDSPGDNTRWLQRGIKIAEKLKHESMKTSFVLQMAKMKYKQMPHEDVHSIPDSDIHAKLKNLMESKNCLVKAEAHLLYGMLRKDAEFCHKAWEIYHSVDHRIGQLEAFNQVLKLNKEHVSDQTWMTMCQIANETALVFLKGAHINKVIQDGLRFYCLQKIGVYYYIPPQLDIWIGERLPECVYRSNTHDSDGMMRLEPPKVLAEIATHCKSLMRGWLLKCGKSATLESKLQSFTPHEDLLKHHGLLRSYSVAEVSTKQLSDYLKTILDMLELKALTSGDADSFCAILVSIFMPDVHIYLHQQSEESHVSLVRSHLTVALHSQLQSFVKVANKSSGSSVTDMDAWLTAWRTSCISEVVMRLLQKVQKCIVDRANVEFGSELSSPPDLPSSELQECHPGFIHWKSDGKLYHLFSLWLHSCFLVREKGKFLWASQLALTHFLGNIAKQSDLCRLGVMNAVNILCIHCTGILAMLSHVRCIQKYPTPLTIPLLYRSIVNLFSAMNSWKREDKHVLMACADEVDQSRDIKSLGRDGCQLLIQALEFLLGHNVRDHDCSILRTGLQTALSSIATKQCLILVFVLLGNLSMLSTPDIHVYLTGLRSMLHSYVFLRHSKSVEAIVPKHVLMSYNAIKDSNILDPPEIFKLVGELLRDAELDSTLARFTLKELENRHKIEIVPVEDLKREQDVVHHESVDEIYRLEDEDLSAALVCRAPDETVSRVEQEFIEPSLTFCNACGVELSSTSSPSSKDTEQSSNSHAVAKEFYLSHVGSDPHRSNVALCKQYTEEVYPPETQLDVMTPLDKDAAPYHELHHHLTTLLAELKTVFNSDRLDQPIGDIEDELDRNDKLLSELEEKCNWKKAVREISKMKKSMDELLYKYKRVSADLKERQLQQEGEENDANELESDEEDLDQFLDVGDDPSGTNKSTVLRSESDKLKSRRRKKARSNTFAQAAN